MTDSQYIELRAHTAFSFSDGSVTPEALVRRAGELGYPAIGITDAADLGGVVRFVCEARRAGIRPIVGAELVVDGYPTAFLVENAEGYRNLAALVTLARVGDLTTWDREHPHTVRGQAGVRWADVAGRSAGLTALTGPPSGRLAALLRAGCLAMPPGSWPSGARRSATVSRSRCSGTRWARGSGRSPTS